MCSVAPRSQQASTRVLPAKRRRRPARDLLRAPGRHCRRRRRRSGATRLHRLAIPRRCPRLRPHRRTGRRQDHLVRSGGRGDRRHQGSRARVPPTRRQARVARHDSVPRRPRRGPHRARRPPSGPRPDHRQAPWPRSPPVSALLPLGRLAGSQRPPPSRGRRPRRQRRGRTPRAPVEDRHRAHSQGQLRPGPARLRGPCTRARPGPAARQSPEPRHARRRSCLRRVAQLPGGCLRTRLRGARHRTQRGAQDRQRRPTRHRRAARRRRSSVRRPADRRHARLCPPRPVRSDRGVPVARRPRRRRGAYPARARLQTLRRRVRRAPRTRTPPDRGVPRGTAPGPADRRTAPLRPPRPGAPSRLRRRAAAFLPQPRRVARRPFPADTPTPCGTPSERTRPLRRPRHLLARRKAAPRRQSPSRGRLEPLVPPVDAPHRPRPNRLPRCRRRRPPSAGRRRPGRRPSAVRHDAPPGARRRRSAPDPRTPRRGHRTGHDLARGRPLRRARCPRGLPRQGCVGRARSTAC